MKSRCTVFIFLNLISSLLFASPSSDSLVTLGWKLWNENKQADVEHAFVQASQADPNDARSYLSLSFLYSLQNKIEKSWDAYKKAVQLSSNPNAYLFAEWVTEKFRNHPDPVHAGIIDMVEKLADDESAAGIMQACANEMLGTYYEKRNDLKKSKKYFDNMKSIESWKLIGPFDNLSASGFDNTFPPEQEFDPAKSYLGKNGVPTQWFVFKTIRNDRWIDFTRYFGYDNAVYFANTFIYSSSKRKVHLRIGTSGSLKTYLNDDLIMAVRDENNNDLDTYIAETELQEGWNRVLLKCGFSEISNCNFMVRLTDLQGRPLEDIKVSTENQAYHSHPQAPTVMLENFAEHYFLQQIAQHPDHPENYFLLADTYLRNDKANEAEEIMRALMKQLPSCAMVYSQLIEVYARGEKRKEIGDLFEKMYSLDNAIPGAIAFQYYQFMGNEDFDNAEKKLKEFAKLLPDDKESYTLYIDFYTKKKQSDKLLQYANEAYAKYPTDWEFVKLHANIVFQVDRKIDDAIKVVQEYLKKNYDVNGVYTLAELYLRKGDVSTFETVYNSLFQLLPPSPGYYLQWADVYVQLQQYAKAEAVVRKAMDITPGNAGVFEKLGDVLAMEKKNAEAKDAYRSSLVYQPTRYDARESLRDLEGKPDIYSNFPAMDVKSLAAKSPAADAYPEDAALYLLDDTKRIVYPEGASEYAREIMVKVFNSRGIDYFKEYSIGYNSHSEKLIVEKAVVIKKGSNETKADVDGNTIVFKSLEEGDVIHIKWKVKNFYNGSLSRHFWDNINFNGFLPIALVRYSLLVPRGKQFSYSMQNGKTAPIIDTLADGIRYTWRETDVPAIWYEKGMPVSEDIGVILHISSIPSWEYIVQWYSDIAKEKTRSSYEVREQVKELFAGKVQWSEEEKIQTIYNFVTEKIRYSYESFRQSSFVPQSARNVIVHKLGDCKDVATLCIAMLNEVGIKAYHVLVNTRDEGSNDNMLPSIAFNHCIVGVETSPGRRFFDLTAYNYPAGSLPPMDQYAFALMIKPGEKAPLVLDQKQFMGRNITREQHVTINKDNSVSISMSSVRTGSMAGLMRSSYRNLGKKEQEKSLLQSLTEDFASVKLTSFEFENLDKPQPTITSKYSFSVPNVLTKAGGLTILKNPWTDKLKPLEALSYDERKYAFNYFSGTDTIRETTHISFDPKWKPVDVKPVKLLSSKYGDYKVTYAVSKGGIVGTRELILKKEIIASSEYHEFREFYNAVVKEDDTNIVFKSR